MLQCSKATIRLQPGSAAMMGTKMANKNSVPQPTRRTARDGLPARPAAPSRAVATRDQPVSAPPIETVASLAVVEDQMTAPPETQTKKDTHMDKAMKSAEEMVSFGQGNVEAMMKASQIWTAGLQDLGKHFAATAQAQMDETMASIKTLSSVKSVKEAMELQTGMAKAAMEKMLAATGQISDASVKLAEQAMAPITARITLATETFGRTTA